MNIPTMDMVEALGFDHPRMRERIALHVAAHRRMAVGAETCRAEPDVVSAPPSSGVYEREDAEAIRARILGACREHMGVDRANGEGREGEEHGGGTERGEQHRVNLTSAGRRGQL